MSVIFDRVDAPKAPFKLLGTPINWGVPMGSKKDEPGNVVQRVYYDEGEHCDVVLDCVDFSKMDLLIGGIVELKPGAHSDSVAVVSKSDHVITGRSTINLNRTYTFKPKGAPHDL